jgi:hypothetical protein
MSVPGRGAVFFSIRIQGRIKAAVRVLGLIKISVCF